MSSTDRSQTERIRRLRGQIQAVRRAECAACPELGPQGPTDQSTWLNRRFGQAPYLREAANGAIQTLSCCGTGPLVCDASTINFDDYIAFIETLQPGSTFNVIFTIDGSVMTVKVYEDGILRVTEERPIKYIQSDTTLTAEEFDTYFYVNNSANTINVTFPGGILEPVTIQLTPCGAL
jgi:hypothetical protein